MSEKNPRFSKGKKTQAFLFLSLEKGFQTQDVRFHGFNETAAFRGIFGES